MSINTGAIMFLPALLCDSRLFKHAISRFSADAKVIVPNITGGENLSAMAADILKSAPARFALVGNSMGGYLALEIAAQASDRVSHLALVGTNAHADFAEAREKRQQAIRLAEGGKFDQFVHSYVESALAPHHRVEHGPLMRTMARDLGPDVLVRQQKAIMARVDHQPLLQELTMPSMVMFGREDGLSNELHQQDMAKNLPNCRFFEVPSCGHLVPLEAPELFSGALAALLHA
jgi:pimeloyl-ACP methyl ester carboxylesterase